MSTPAAPVTVSAMTDGPDETEALGRRLSAALPAGSVVGLVGPLGAGKTCFVRGMAAGLAIDPDEVASPTFVYLVDYTSADGRRLYHADLYRLADLPADSAEEVFDGIGLYAAMCDDGGDAAGAITVVEWWEHYRGAMPERLVVVEFAIEKADHRAILLAFSGTELEPVAEAFAGAAGGERTTSS